MGSPIYISEQQASPNSATTNSSSISDGSEQQQQQQQQSLNLYPVGQQQQSTESSSTTPTTSSTASTATCPAGSGNSSSNSSSQQQQQQHQPQSSLQSNVQRSGSAPTGPRPQMLSTGSNTSTASIPLPGTSQRQGNNDNRTLRRNQSRTEAIKNYIKRETATFFGVDEESEAAERQKWLDRRRRMASRKYGALLPEYKPPDPDITKDVPDALEVTDSVTLRKWQRPARTKDSVARMTLSGIQYLVDTLRRQRPLSDRGETSRSFPPSATHTTTEDVLHTDEGATSDPNAEDDDEEEAFFRAPQGLQQQQQQQQQQQIDGQSQLTDEIMSAASAAAQGKSIDVEDGGGAGAGAAAAATLDSIRIGVDSMWSAESLTSADKQQQHPEERSSIDGHSRRAAAHKAISSKDHYTLRTRPEPEVQYHHPQAEAILPRVKTTFGGKRIHPSTIDRVFDNSNRRLYGMGIVGRFFGRSFRKSVAQKPDVRRQLDDFEDHRPYFTYWITTVQLLILIISLACYGFGPVGLDLHHRSSLVLVTSLSLQQVEYQEPANFWLGPRASDLIHLGAKFAPCMRRDIKILKEIDVWREKERDTACCIRNDDSGCVQSSRAECSNTISTWKKWGPADSGPGGRISGSVCGLDPKFCDAPASIAPYEWPDDITKWPICRKINPFSQRFRSKQESNGPGNANFPIGYKDKMAEHMVCEVIGHPCCIGIHGTCRITTKEYCDFVHGYFHEEASLCSQVECLHDVCGMIPFLHPEWPDQFYRLFTTTFLHAGIFHIAITLLVQYFLMRDLEKLTGSVRIALIYFIGALAGNLASAIFVPYRAEVGPAGAHFALLATLVVEVLHCWPMLKYPRRALSKLMIILVGLLMLGVLPWVDNYAHLFGFIFGFLAAYALMPFISFGHYDRRRKIFVIWICSLLILGLFGLLLALFYNVPMYECELCKLFNCIPFTRDFCASQNINFKREEPV
ncbi:hypothetical protein TKK_0000054 [Trichogramma kaykai]